MPAVPTAQPFARAVAGGVFKALVAFPVVFNSAAAMIYFALPPGVVTRAAAAITARAAVCAHFHKFAAHFVSPGYLQLACCLVYTRKHCPPHSHLQCVPVACRVRDIFHILRQSIHSAFYGCLVIKCPGRHLQPCAVECIFKLSCDRIRCRAGKVLPRPPRLPISGVQQVE